jgi:hypothetical protein
VAEAVHASGLADIQRLTAAVTEELTAIWPTALKSVILSAASPRFDF